MSVVSRVSESGEIVIPEEIRERLGLKPGDTVVWEVNMRGRVEVEPLRYTVDELCGILPPLRGVETSEDMERMIKEAFEESVPDKIREFSDE